MRRELMRTAARLYYLEDWSQQRIAEQLGVSRPIVSRLLSSARRDGIVTITVEPPAMPTALANELSRELELRQAFVTPTTVGDTWSEVATSLGFAMGALDLPAEPVCLVSWGRTMWDVAGHRQPPYTSMTVVPMIAGVDEPAPWFETNGVTRRVATAFSARSRFLHAPVHPSPALRAELFRDEYTLRTLQLWDRADVAILGIGAPPATRPGYGPQHHLRRRDQLSRAVGDVAARYFDLRGNHIPYDDENHLLATPWDTIAAIPARIGIGVGDNKAPGIVGAARSGLVDIVVTDAMTARRALEIVGTERRS